MSFRISRKWPFFPWIRKKALNPIRPRGISTSSQPKESPTKMINGLFMGLSGDLDPCIPGPGFYRELPGDSPRGEIISRSSMNVRSSGDLTYPLQDPGDPQGKKLVKSARNNTPKRLKTRINPPFIMYSSMDISGGDIPRPRARCRPIFHHGNDSPGQDFTPCRQEIAKTADPLLTCLKASAASNLLHRLMQPLA